MGFRTTLTWEHQVVAHPSVALCRKHLQRRWASEPSWTTSSQPPDLQRCRCPKNWKISFKTLQTLFWKVTVLYSVPNGLHAHRRHTCLVHTSSTCVNSPASSPCVEDQQTHGCPTSSCSPRPASHAQVIRIAFFFDDTVWSPLPERLQLLYVLPEDERFSVGIKCLSNNTTGWAARAENSQPQLRHS